MSDDAKRSSPFVWFDGDSVATLKAALNARTNPRLEVHTVGESTYLWVYEQATDTLAADEDPVIINDSKTCPIWCPN